MTCLKSHPVSLSSISFLIFIIKSCFTKDGLPLLGLSFSPSIPLSLYLLYHLYAHALDLCILVLPFRYAVYLLVHVLLKESFLLHQHHIRICMPCLVLWISTSTKLL